MLLVISLICLLFLVNSTKGFTWNGEKKSSSSSLFQRSSVLFAGKEVEVTNLTTNQKINIPAGSPLSLAAVRSGLRLSFQCKQGTCASCETILNGKVVRTCITKVPDMKKVTLKKAPKL